MSQGFQFSRLRQRGPSQYAFGMEEQTDNIMQKCIWPTMCVGRENTNMRGGKKVAE